MAAPTVYDDVAEGTILDGHLFAGKKFWVAQRIPQRLHYLGLIKNNGGSVVALEKNADYIIADHLRPTFCPPGSISYTFIEKSIKEGRIQDAEYHHRAGPPIGTTRSLGSRTMPAKVGRAKFTAEEDRILYKWVRDCEAQNRLVSGNEIYKQLEVEHPRHSWSSWRDRYLKQLRDRPPSAFNVPDNAPPSPDGSVEPKATPKPAPATNPATKSASTTGNSETAPSTKGSGDGDKLSLEELGKLFDQEEWELLYAFKEEIDNTEGKQYADGWEGFAEGKTQSAAMWRKYFERVVRPQWIKDPAAKRQRIRDLVEARSEERASQKASQENGTQDGSEEAAVEIEPPFDAKVKSPKGKRKRDEDEDARFEQHLTVHCKGKASSAYDFFAQERKYSAWHKRPSLDYTELHKLLMTEWNALSPQEKAPYFALQQTSEQNEATRDSPQVCLTSSTAVPETPKYINEAYEKARKRMNEDRSTETPRPAKQQKSEVASPSFQVVPDNVIEQSFEISPGLGAQDQPFEISSGESSSSYSQNVQDDSTEDATLVDRQLQEMIAQQTVAESEKSAEDADSDLDIEGLEAIAPPPKEIEPDFPSDTPTPRAPRYKAPAFDTQAILSSPTQGSFAISALPRPPSFAPDEEESEIDLIEEDEEDGYGPQNPTAHPFSPGREPPSDESTTHSMQEFRRSLNKEDGPPSHPPSSPSSSSTTSGDPDPPLDNTEIDEFFEAQRTAGFTDKWITTALKITRCRPDLTEQVLDAWKRGEALPTARGIWSKEDDEDVEDGDAVTLKMLERKHTFDGWGGITERMRFLEQYRERG